MVEDDGSKDAKEKCVLKHSRPPGTHEVGSTEDWWQVRFHVDICATHRPRQTDPGVLLKALLPTYSREDLERALHSTLMVFRVGACPQSAQHCYQALICTDRRSFCAPGVVRSALPILKELCAQEGATCWRKFLSWQRNKGQIRGSLQVPRRVVIAEQGKR